MLFVHISGGGLGLIFGAAALSAAKGGNWHRKSGMLFVYAIVTMCATGLVMALWRGAAPAVNVPAALLTAYLVVTALVTVRPPEVGLRWLNIGALLVALAVGLVSLGFGVEALAAGGARDDIPAFPFFMFGVVGVLAAALDVRMIRSGGLTGAARLTRHLWRMCFALFITAMSFFLGQADEIPEPLRIPALLALPIVAVLVSMLYWLWRVRIRRSFRGILDTSTAEAG